MRLNKRDNNGAYLLKLPKKDKVIGVANSYKKLFIKPSEIKRNLHFSSVEVNEYLDDLMNELKLIRAMNILKLPLDKKLDRDIFINKYSKHKESDAYRLVLSNIDYINELIDAYYITDYIYLDLIDSMYKSFFLAEIKYEWSEYKPEIFMLEYLSMLYLGLLDFFRGYFLVCYNDDLSLESFNFNLPKEVVLDVISRIKNNNKNDILKKEREEVVRMVVKEAFARNTSQTLGDLLEQAYFIIKAMRF